MNVEGNGGEGLGMKEGMNGGGGLGMMEEGCVLGVDTESMEGGGGPIVRPCHIKCSSMWI